MTDAELVSTIKRWQRQVWEQIYLLRAGSARQELDSAWREWHKTLGTIDVRRALEIYLHLLDYDCAATFSETEQEKRRLVLEAIGKVEPPCRTRLAESCRSRVLLILRSHAHILGARELYVHEVKQLLSGIPQETLGHQTCMNLALWAYSIRNSEFLQLAYRLFLINPYDFMLDFTRQRVRVMLSLIEGECDAAEVAKLIAALPHPLHAQWFADQLIPELERQSLWQEPLLQAFNSKRDELLEAEASIPPRERQPEILGFEL